MREASVSRRTAETDVAVAVALDGTGKAEISTGIGFLDHMLELLARHALIDLTVRVTGDLQVDQHHTTEDAGIALGQAVAQALGDKKGIARYACIHLPMDETLYGENSHHIAESCFKGLARTLRHAVAVDPREAGRVPSTKGTL